MSDERVPVTPLVLLVDDQEWTSRSIESILRPKGHVVVKAYTGRQALELAARVNPDAILLDVHLPDLDGIDVARELRNVAGVTPLTPLLMMSNSSLSRAERIEALGAGAWDILHHPVDPNELILRLGTFVRAKHLADRFREEGLTDPTTGFYNARGLLRRTRELAADASRSERPIACVALGPDWSADAAPEERRTPAPDSEIASALRTFTRASDTVGRLSSGEFVIVALGTDREGAERLADRVLEYVAQRVPGLVSAAIDPNLGLRAGLYAATPEDAPGPEDILFRATMALRRAQADERGTRIRPYDA